MTDQDKRAQFGEVLVSIEETKKELKHRTHKLKTIGEALGSLGNMLQHGMYVDLEPESLEALDRQKIVELMAEANQLQGRLRKLEDTKTELA